MQDDHQQQPFIKKEEESPAIKFEEEGFPTIKTEPESDIEREWIKTEQYLTQETKCFDILARTGEIRQLSSLPGPSPLTATNGMVSHVPPPRPLPNMENRNEVDAFMARMGCKEANQIFCLGCGQNESLEHRINWLNCAQVCWQCRTAAGHLDGKAGQACPMWANRRGYSFWCRRDGRPAVMEQVQHLFATNTYDQAPQGNSLESWIPRSGPRYARGAYNRGPISRETTSGRVPRLSSATLSRPGFHFRFNSGVPVELTRSLPHATLSMDGRTLSLTEGTTVEVNQTARNDFVYNIFGGVISAVIGNSFADERGNSRSGRRARKTARRRAQAEQENM